MDALLKRFLTEDILQETINVVTRSIQKEGEDEEELEKMVSTGSRQCGHVFSKADVVNYYIWGMNPFFQEFVAQKVRLIPVSDLVNLAALKQASVAIGKSQ